MEVSNGSSVLQLDIAKLFVSRTSSSADVSDSIWISSSDDRNTKLYVDETKFLDQRVAEACVSPGHPQPRRTLLGSCVRL